MLALHGPTITQVGFMVGLTRSSQLIQFNTVYELQSISLVVIIHETLGTKVVMENEVESILTNLNHRLSIYNRLYPVDDRQCCLLS